MTLTELYRINEEAMMVADTVEKVAAALVPVEDETLNTLAKSLDDGYEWEQLIPRLMNLPPNVVLYEKHPCDGDHFVPEHARCLEPMWVQVWPEVSDDS